MLKIIDKCFGRFCDFIEEIKNKLDADKYGKQKKFYLSVIAWYLFGVLTIPQHPTMLLFIGMCFVVYHHLFDKPKG